MLSYGQVSITTAEYFWDTDPGEGNGTIFTVADGNFDNALEAIFESGIVVPAANGLHTFNVRMQNSNSVWGNVFTQVIDVSDNPVGTNAAVTLAEAEYFWNTDPGEGNGIAFTVADGSFDNPLEALLEIGIAVPSTTGLHTFNARIKNSNNTWGNVFTQIIDVSDDSVGTNAVVTLTEAEYFWDTDPGEGNGIAFTAADGNFDNALERLAVASIDIVNPVGLHAFNVRLKNSDNTWGNVFTQVIDIETTLSIAENSFGEDLKLVPNPSRTYTNVQLGAKHTNVNLVVIDIMGKQVFSANYNSTDTIEVDTSRYTSGMYIINITSEKKKASLKLIVK